VAGRKPLPVSGRHPRPPSGRPDVLVLRHDLHLHPGRQLDRSRPGHRVGGVTTRRTASCSSSRCCAVPTPTSI
jgi:hypothetical protein